MINDFITLAFIILLFVALTPGLYFTYPSNGPKFAVALFHGTAFALILYFTHSVVRRLFRKVNEGFKDTSTTAVAASTTDTTTISDVIMPPPARKQMANADDQHASKSAPVPVVIAEAPAAETPATP